MHALREAVARGRVLPRALLCAQYHRTDDENGLLFDKDYAQGLKQRILEIKVAIEEGKFMMRPSETNCEYCPHERICHKDIVLHKAVDGCDGGDDEAE